MPEIPVEPPESMRLRRFARRWALVVVGLLLGSAGGLVELMYVLVSGIVLLPRRRGRVAATVFGGAHALAEQERRRLALFLRSESAGEYSGRRALGYLALRAPVGILGGAVLFLILFGAIGAPVTLVEYWAGNDADSRKALISGYLILLTAVLAYLAMTGVAGVAALERALARRFLGPSREELLSRRVETLSTTRAEVVDAVNDERRRIERDLHDGVQQRLVSLGMLIGRARRSGEEGKTMRLLTQAHEESQLALRDLREVAWRVYPAALDAGGLRPALDMVADRAGLPVRISAHLDTRPPAAVETAAYFVVSEAVTNAAKHSGAGSVTVHIGQQGERVEVRVTDDGCGGARPDGAGLSGLARRVAALDGEFRVHSPVGGPTEITAELPCG